MLNFFIGFAFFEAGAFFRLLCGGSTERRPCEAGEHYL